MAAIIIQTLESVTAKFIVSRCAFCKLRMNFRFLQKKKNVYVVDTSLKRNFQCKKTCSDNNSDDSKCSENVYDHRLLSIKRGKRDKLH